MTTGIATTITITTCICACVITSLLMIGTALGGNLTEKVYRWFFIALFINTIGSCFEGLAALLTGMPGENIAIFFRVADFFSYALGSVVAIAFILYVYEYLSLKKRVSKEPFIFMIVCLSVNIVLIAVGQITARFSLLDANNNYDPQGLTVLAQIPSDMVLLTLIIVTLVNIKWLKPREWVSLLIYAATPIVCYGIENIFMAYPLWICYFGVSIVLLLLYVNIQVELKHTLIKKETELMESRMAVMLSQIRPHFLYNSLTAIGKLCDIDPKKAKGAVTDFADYLRGNLESMEKHKLVYFEDELAHIEAYLALEQLRYKERLQVAYKISVKDFILPPLTVQPIVENAVQHGLMEKKEGGTVTIRTAADSHMVRITISDDGVGYDETCLDGTCSGETALINGRRTHIGIENVRGRLSALCHGRLEIHSIPGIGTTAVISVPYNIDQEGTST